MKITTLAPVFLGLIVTACSSPPKLPPPTANLPSNLGAGQGIDLATNSSDVLSELTQTRLDFVARYYRALDSRWPSLSASEAQQLSALGLKIVAVWESHGRKPAYFNYASGYGDAMTAYLEAKGVGQPAGSAIYFAVDFNAQRLAPIEDYFRGVAAGFAAASGGNPEYGVGVYGSGLVCDDVKRAGLARYSWLSNSFAWTQSIGYEDWNIRQGSRLPELTFNNDSDEARDEYGAFQLAAPVVARSSPSDGSGSLDLIARR